jgi:hypothetical protein
MSYHCYFVNYVFDFDFDFEKNYFLKVLKQIDSNDDYHYFGDKEVVNKRAIKLDNN